MNVKSMQTDTICTRLHKLYFVRNVFRRSRRDRMSQHIKVFSRRLHRGSFQRKNFFFEISAYLRIFGIAFLRFCKKTAEKKLSKGIFFLNFFLVAVSTPTRSAIG